MNDPIDTGAFTHYLIFESLGIAEPYRIKEPQGFSTINFSMKQNPERFSRDFSYIASGDKALRFNKIVGEFTGTEQVVNPQGHLSKFLDHGLAWILESDRRFGFESKIKYVLKKDRVVFDAGYLSVAEKDTDGYNYFACNVVQDNRIAIYKKRVSEKIDMFSTKNYKNQTITPAPTLDFLRKALPQSKTSTWTAQGINTAIASKTVTGAGGSPTIFTSQQLVCSSTTPVLTGLEYSLTSTNVVQGNDSGIPTHEAFVYFRAKHLTTNIKVNIKNIVATSSALLPLIGITSGTGSVKFMLKYGSDIHTATTVILYQRDFNGTESSAPYPSNYPTVEIPLLNIGDKIWIYSAPQVDTMTYAFGAPDGFGYTIFNIDNGGDIEISAVQTALNTVVRGVRVIDMQKQCSKHFEDVPVNAPKWDVGGDLYDQVGYSRAGISQNTSVPFITEYGECMGSTQEVCGDYENRIEEIKCGQFADFYTNDEIAVFAIKPSSTIKESWNERSMLNGIIFGFEKYQDDSNLDQNTMEDIHTSAEWSIANEAATNILERTFKWIRSGFSKQKAFDLEITKPETADKADNDVYIDDVVPLAPNSFYEWGAKLNLTRLPNGDLTILNKAIGVDSEEVVINWLILGIKVGDQFYITAGVNIGIYSIVSIDRALLTLHPVTATVATQGDNYIKVKYYYTNVLYQTSTNEGFTIVDGISNAAAYPSLKKSLRRIFNYWNSLIHTACAFIPDSTIQNTFFKSNGKLRTQLLPTDPIYIENEDILVSTLDARIISSRVFDIECVVTFEQMVAFFEAYRLSCGFARAFDANDRILKGYAQELEYMFSTNRLKLKLEQKHEDEIILLNYSLGVLSVNDTRYVIGGASDWWVLENGFFTAYDIDSVPICEPARFDYVSLDGIIYGTAAELLDALGLL